MEEEWKPILDYPDYEVSNLGNVRRNNKLLKPCILKRGYPQINLCKNGKAKSTYIHRLVAQAFLPNLDNKPEVDHIDRNRTNNVVTNLRWATRSENQLNTNCRNNDFYGIQQRGNLFHIGFTINKKKIWFGYRSTLEEAKQLRDSVLNLRTSENLTETES